VNPWRDQGSASGAVTLKDYADLARRSLGPDIWDFIEGGAGDERTLAENLAAFDRARLRPQVLTAVVRPDTTVRVLGRTWPLPIAVAPMGYHTLAHPDGETATAKAAGAAGVPLVVSTFAGRTFEDIAAAAAAPLWLQVYCFRDRAVTQHLIQRAERAGFEALVLTVDAPLLGRRPRDLRNAFRLPPAVAPANLSGSGFVSPGEHALNSFDPALDWSVVEWLRSVSSLPVLLKGIMTASDAGRAVDAGAAGIVVSNHGGRQLDGVRASIDALPEIAETVVGACAVLLDSGVRRGSDILVSLERGADAVFAGRPVLHGLAVDGGDGVARVLDILAAELTEAMILTGTGSPAEARQPARARTNRL
jgi:(S)-3,5-dihydroxyphenylglycine transaminase